MKRYAVLVRYRFFAGAVGVWRLKRWHVGYSGMTLAEAKKQEAMPAILPSGAYGADCRIVGEGSKLFQRIVARDW